MTVETYVDRARSRVRDEQEAVRAKQDAFDQFIDHVSSLPAATAPSGTGVTATVGTQLQTDRVADDQCRAVRKAFEETIRPHSCETVDDPEPLLQTIKAEFTESIAAALASTTPTSFSPELKRAILTEANSRQTETTALLQALDTELDSLETAAETVTEITDWLVDSNEQPLTDFGFDALQCRHEQLATYREHCDELARDRQTDLQRTTSQTLDAGIRHRELVAYLYRAFPVDHPVLATAVRLDSLCAGCQRTVREHLVRRV